MATACFYCLLSRISALLRLLELFSAAQNKHGFQKAGPFWNLEVGECARMTKRSCFQTEAEGDGVKDQQGSGVLSVKASAIVSSNHAPA